MRVNGQWQGKMLDASGTVSLVVMDLNENDGEVKGDFSVYTFSARDTCSGGKKLAQVASVDGVFDTKDKSGRLKLVYKLDVRKSPVEVVFEAEIVNADPHARWALVGNYAVKDKAARVGMEGGSCVLWQYVSKRGG